MPTNDMFAALDVWFSKKNVPDIAEGRVDSAKDGQAYVKINGTSNAQVAIYDKRVNSSIARGDRCMLVRTSRTAKWVILASYGSAMEGSVVANGSGQVTELAPPTNLSVRTVASYNLWSWDAPYQQPVSFEVQISATADELSGSTAILTRGSYFFFETKNDTFYVRVRSIALDGRRSGWTSWITSIVIDTGSGTTSNVKQYITSFAYNTLNSDGSLACGTTSPGETVTRVRLYIDTLFTPYVPTFSLIHTSPNSPADASLMSSIDAPEAPVSFEFEPFQLYAGSVAMSLSSNIIPADVTFTAGTGRVVIDTSHD